MAGRLFFVIFMYSFHKIQVQALLPPTLTVNPSVITETDSVTLNCQTPPAEVKVTCFYLFVSSSPDSDVSSIIVRTSLPPTLTVNPSVITETDSVTLNCQTPSSISLSQCYFHIVRGEPAKRFSCVQTLTGTELLKITNQSPPAEVKVTCFYLFVYSSPDSDVSSIIIQSQTPQMTLQHYPGNHVLFTCSLPVSANHDTRCNLYFGEASHPVITTTIGRKRDPETNQWFCQFTVTVDDLLSRLRLLQQSNASCDYSLGSESNSMSPRSDGYSLTDIVERESGMTQTIPAFTVSTALTVSRPHTSSLVTPVKVTTVQTPQMTLQHFPGDHVLFICSLPGSANHDTRCNLYFGEASRPVVTIKGNISPKTNQWLCQFTVTIVNLLSRLRLVQQSDASCDYSLGSEPNSLSPRSDGYSLIDIVDREASMTQTIPAFTVSTALTVSMPHASSLVTPVKLASGWTVSTPSSTVGTTSTSLTPEKPTSDFRMTEIKLESGRIWIKMFLVITAGCGVTVGVILLVSAILWNRRRTAGSKEVKRQKHQNENFDTYRLYCNISEEAAASTLNEKCVSKRPNTKVSGKSQDYRDYLDRYGETYSIVTYKCNTGEDANDGRSD